MISALGSSGCSHFKPVPEKPLPESAYHAKPWPPAPSGEYGPKVLAQYIIEAKSAYLDAVARLNALNPYIEE